MKIKSFFISSMCLLTALVGMQQPLMAAKRHKDSSSSSDCSDKQKNAAKKRSRVWIKLIKRLS